MLIMIKDVSSVPYQPITVQLPHRSFGHSERVPVDLVRFHSMEKWSWSPYQASSDCVFATHTYCKALITKKAPASTGSCKLITQINL